MLIRPSVISTLFVIDCLKKQQVVHVPDEPISRPKTNNGRRTVGGSSIFHELFINNSFTRVVHSYFTLPGGGSRCGWDVCGTQEEGDSPIRRQWNVVRPYFYTTTRLFVYPSWGRLFGRMSLQSKRRRLFPSFGSINRTIHFRRLSVFRKGVRVSEERFVATTTPDPFRLRYQI